MHCNKDLVGIFSVDVVFDSFRTWLLELLRSYLDKVGDGGLQRTYFVQYIARGCFEVAKTAGYHILE